LRKLVLGIRAQAIGKNDVVINAYAVSEVIPDSLWRYARRLSRVTYAYQSSRSLSMAGSVWLTMTTTLITLWPKRL